MNIWKLWLRSLISENRTFGFPLRAATGGHSFTQSGALVKDFNGLPIVFREDGYINMTKAIKHFPGKRLDNFKLNPSTVEYVEALEQTLKISVWVAKRGGRKGEAGTWCHPKLAVFFARWLDVRFAVWCDLMIDNILRGNIQTSVVVPTQEAIGVESVVAPLKARILRLCSVSERLEEELKGIREGRSRYCSISDTELILHNYIT